MELMPYDHRDPGALVEELPRRFKLTAPAAYLLVVEEPSDQQRVIYCERMDAPALLVDSAAASDELRARLDTLALPQDPTPGWSPPRHAATVIVVREGLSVATNVEGAWARAWRYANVIAPIYTHGLMVVTEHGWYDLDTTWGGSTPALRSRTDGRLRTA